MADLAIYVFPTLFGLFVGALSAVGVAQDFQSGYVKNWRVLVPWVITTITGVCYIGLLRALAQATAIGPLDPNTPRHVLMIFVACLGGVGLGGLCVMWRFLTRLSLGWQFFELFADLKQNLSDQELRVLISTLTADARPGLFGRIRRWFYVSVRKQRWPTPREQTMKALGIDSTTYRNLFTSALQKFNDHFQKWS